MQIGPTLQQLSGEWALVTGASSGIGAEFCRQLAKAQVNLVLVARRQPILASLAADLSKTFGIKTCVLPTDLSVRGAADTLRQQVDHEGIRIRLLVNNAAFGPWGRFEGSNPEKYEELIQTVLTAPIAICRAFEAQLRSFTGAAVINLSSPAALQPVPHKAVYSGAKTGLHYFSLALYEEWKTRNILVQTLIPGPTQSELDKVGGAYKCALPEEREPPTRCVTTSLQALGKDQPVVAVASGTYKQRFFNGVFPHRFITRTVAKMFEPRPS